MSLSTSRGGRVRLVVALLFGLGAAGAPPIAASQDRLQGTVLDAGSGAPIRGAYVLLAGAGERYVPLARAWTTDGCGRFEGCLDGVEAGGALLVVADGYEPTRRALAGLCAGRRACLALTRGREVRGRAVNPEGRGVPGVRVWAHLPGVTFAWPHTDLCVQVCDRSCGGRAVSDADGRFVLRGLSHGTAYTLRAAARGWLQTGPDGAPGPSSLGPTAAQGGVTLTGCVEAHVVALDAAAREPVGALANLRLGDGLGDVRVPPHAWLAPGLLRAFEEDSAALRLVALKPRSGAALAEGPTLRLSAAGHEDLDLASLPAQGAQQVSLLQRRPGIAFTRLRCEARTRAGLRFDGLLHLTIDSSAGRALHRVRFRDGVAEAPVLVPRVALSVTAAGAGPRGAAWTLAAGPVEVKAPGEGPPTPLSLLLSGTPVTLDVRDASGRAVRGFGLSLATEAGAGPGAGVSTASLSAPDWDTPGVALEPDALDRPAWLWVNAGRTRLHVEHPDLGRAQGVLEADGDGRPATVRLTLPPGAPPPAEPH